MTPESIADQIEDLVTGLPAADVIYALGLMIARGIARQSADQDIKATCRMIIEIVCLEAPRLIAAEKEKQT